MFISCRNMSKAVTRASSMINQVKEIQILHCKTKELKLK